MSKRHIPLLSQEGWRSDVLSAAPGWFLKPQRCGVWNHPVCAAEVASRHFLSGAATPPNLGGELRVFLFGLKKNGNVGIGILPQREQVLV
jgi:hypothetical protein